MGQYQTITYPNGQTRDFSYDDQGRLLQLANVHPTAGSLASFAYGYDLDPTTSEPALLGQRTSLNLTIPSQGLTNALSTYRYDGNYQLIQANYPTPAPFNSETHAWTYDGIGNRLTNTVNGTTQTYSYLKNGSNPLNGQRLSSDGANTYTYDANGNTGSRNGVPDSFSFGWDYNDRMTSITGSATASYAYDYQGRRSSKTVAGATTNYLYDGLNLVRSSSANPADYLFGPGIDEPLAMSKNGTISYFSVDGLGSVSLLADTNGVVQSNTLYDAWGEVRSQTGTVTSDFGYTAREFGEAGNWYYRARYYQSGIGRFGSEDPLRIGGSLLTSGLSPKVIPFRAPYPYAENGPVLWTDPIGEERRCVGPSDSHWSGGLHLIGYLPWFHEQRFFWNLVWFDLVCDDCPGTGVDNVAVAPHPAAGLSRGVATEYALEAPSIRFFDWIDKPRYARVGVSVQTRIAAFVFPPFFGGMGRSIMVCYDCVSGK